MRRESELSTTVKLTTHRLENKCRVERESINLGVMSYTVYHETSRKTVQWSGGTSTEIFVFPSDGDFATRNFDFRISTATVEVAESEFTFFEGITRHLMILKGTLELSHIDRYARILEPYDQDTFSGEWPTKSKGKVTDFNLMLKNGYTGGLGHIQLLAGESLPLVPEAAYDFVFIAEGEAEISGQHIASGNLVKFSKPVVLSAGTDLHLVRIRVFGDL